MKIYNKNIAILLFTLSLLFPQRIYSQGLEQSHHDFRGQPWGSDDLCKPCHPDQNNHSILMDIPLWSLENIRTNFQAYSSTTLDSQPGLPSGKSKLCLTCHDGTIASGGHRVINQDSIPALNSFRTIKLRNDHPISFVYDSKLASIDNGLYDPGTTMSGLGGTISEDMLENGKMECTSCHDVHISRNTEGCKGCHVQLNDGSIKTTSLSLWKPNEKSALCLTCHKK